MGSVFSRNFELLGRRLFSSFGWLKAKLLLRWDFDRLSIGRITGSSSSYFLLTEGTELCQADRFAVKSVPLNILEEQVHNLFHSRLWQIYFKGDLIN